MDLDFINFLLQLTPKGGSMEPLETPLDVCCYIATVQQTCTKSIDMLNKNILDQEKMRPSWKHHSAYSYIHLKSVLSGGGQGPTELFASSNARSNTYSSYTCIIIYL